MSEHDTWSEVDAYVVDHLIGADPALDAALEDARAADLPPISVSPPQGKLLYLTARSIGARRILEFGTLAGYSTTWLARALPAGGRVTTLEMNEKHAKVARANLERAGVADRVEIKVGPALETLPRLAPEVADEPFDLVFIDADKDNIPAYFDWSVLHTRPGGVIVVDNVVRNGALVDTSQTDGAVQGVRTFHDRLTTRTDVEATTIQTVGSKGYDGFTFALVNGR